jgi:hemolysin activation/secretion protein
MDVKCSAIGAVAILTNFGIATTALAQPAPNRPDFPRQETPPQPTPTILPSQPNPLPTTPTLTPTPVEPGEIGQINVLRYEVSGSTVFSPQELATVTQPFTGRVTFAQVQAARNAVNQLYLQRNYFTSGAYIPAGQVLTVSGAVVKIQIVEGRLEDIKITGTQRLNSNYIRSRLALATQQPLNSERLLEGLRLLQQDPLIESINAELSAGVQPGTNLLEVRVKERQTWSSELAINDNRSTSIGSLQRRLQVTQANLTGLGDSIAVAYGNTDGSNGLDFSYTVPLSPQQTTLTVAVGGTDSQIIEEPYRSLDFRTSSRYYEVGIRQPLVRRAGPNSTQEFALSLTASKQESSSTFSGVPFPLGRGADVDGRTNVAALRFGQEYLQRDSRSVLALRSQLNWGIEGLGSTVNPTGPDGRFVSWQGQGRWLRRLAVNTDLVVQGRVQLADRPLPAAEQLSIGGQSTVRGYRQDRLAADNGAFAAVELQLPVLQSPSDVVQIAPFMDVGTVWNNDGSSPAGSSTLLSVGLGLQWRRENLTARLDWGIPLINGADRPTNLQENGLYFSLRYFP